MTRYVTVALIGLGLVACSRSHEEGDAAEAAVVSAGTALATTQPFPLIIQAIGTVTGRAGHFAQLAAPAPTRVAKVFVAAGDHVHAGDTLIEFERAPFDAAARSAEAALVSAQHGYDRAVRLVEAGIMAQKDSDQAAADLAQAQAAAVTARRAQELATLRSPISGVVTRMSAVMGASADPSQALVDVADPRALDVVFNVTPSDAARLQVGDTGAVTSGEGANGERLGRGVVTAVGAAVDSVTRGVMVRALIAQPERPLKIGESVSGQLVAAVHAAAVTVPVAALVPAGDGFQVFVVDSGGIAHVRPVTIGGRTEALVEITSGLAAGERVVTRGAYGVADGARITTTTTTTPR